MHPSTISAPTSLAMLATSDGRSYLLATIERITLSASASDSSGVIGGFDKCGSD
jgi:hypothetical protein